MAMHPPGQNYWYGHCFGQLGGSVEVGPRQGAVTGDIGIDDMVCACVLKFPCKVHSPKFGHFLPSLDGHEAALGDVEDLGALGIDVLRQDRLAHGEPDGETALGVVTGLRVAGEHGGVRGEDAITLLQFNGLPIVKAKQFGRGKVIVAGVGMSFLDCYLGDFEHREPLHLIMFYDFIRYLTDIDWKKNCKQDFIETILSRCRFEEK